MKKLDKYYYVLFLLSLTFFFYINTITLYNGQNWGGDFAQYFIHAKNVLNQQPYAEGVYATRTTGYPVGYPLLILPFFKLFGINFLPLKIINLMFWLGFTAVTYLFLKRRFDTQVSLLGAIIFLLSPFLFLFKHQVLPDLIFAFFTVTGLYYFEKYDASLENLSRRKNLVLALIMLSAAMLFRTVGMVLFGIAIGFYLILKRDWKATVALIVVFCLMAVITELTGSGMQRYVGSNSRLMTTDVLSL